MVAVRRTKTKFLCYSAARRAHPQPRRTPPGANKIENLH